MFTYYENVKAVIEHLKPAKSVYCLSPRNIQKQVQLFLKYFPGTVSWAVKSNPEPVVIQTIYESGVRDFDVASENEIKLVYQLCPNARLHFNHPIKSPESIEAAYHKYKIRVFVADHRDEILKIASVLKHHRDVTLLIRFIDPQITPASHVNFGKKFGATPTEVMELLTLAKTVGFYKIGLAFHPSTQYPDPAIYGHLLNVASKFTKYILENDLTLEMINIGGGFPVPYPSETLPSEHEYLSVVQNAIHMAKKTLPPQCEFVCEPGRALVANCASLVTRVELNRHDGRIYLNDGFYGGLMEQYFVDYALPVCVHTHNNRLLENEKDECILFGPTCDSVDVLRKKYLLPKNLEIGDYIEFGLMGAYTNASATHFNGFDPAEIICVKDLNFL